jgi:putative membrane protein (TIGR04086 family)
MGKKPATAPVWAVLLRGCALSLAVYLGGLLLLASLLVRGAVPEGAAFPATAALCALGALSGGLAAARRTPWGTLPSALLNSAVFAAVLAGAGGLWQQSLTWTGRGGVLALCVLGGGAAAGVLGSRRPRRRKRKS